MVLRGVLSQLTGIFFRTNPTLFDDICNPWTRMIKYRFQYGNLWNNITFLQDNFSDCFKKTFGGKWSNQVFPARFSWKTGFYSITNNFCPNIFDLILLIFEIKGILHFAYTRCFNWDSKFLANIWLIWHHFCQNMFNIINLEEEKQRLK